MWKAAEKYNEQIKQESVPDAFSIRDGQTDPVYESLLNLNGDGMMGYVEVPVIGQNIPIYHYTTEDSLQKGAGHLFGSSLPVGGESTHCILSAHRGLPSASLFSDLDQLEEGDHFLIHVLNETLCYEVDKISVVKPEETSSLAVEEGKDLVTLVTCTPYGVNTHRLLVRGIRTEYVEEEESNETIPQMLAKTDPRKVLAAGSVVLVILILLVYLIVRRGEKRRVSGEKEEAEKSGKEN